MRTPILIRLALRLRDRWPLILGALGISALNQTAGLALAAVSAVMVGAIATGQSTDLGRFVVVVGSLTLAKAVLSWLDQWYLHWVAIGVVAALRADAYLALEPLAPAYTIRRRSGDVVSMMMADVDQLQPFYARTLVPTTIAVVLSVAVLVALGLTAPPLVLALAPFLVMIAATPAIGWRIGIPLARAVRERQGMVAAHLVDGVQGLRELVAFGQADQRITDVERNSRWLASAQMRNSAFVGTVAGTTDLIVAGGSVAVLLTAMWLVASGQLTPSLLPLVLMLAFAAFRAVVEVVDVAKNLTQVAAAARRYFEVVDEPVLVRELVTESPGPLSPALEFDRVTFAYSPAEPPVLREVAFSIEPGETVALVGPSGAGKSTCASLLLRFWDPDRGQIRIGGLDIRALPLDDLRRRVAIVQQENYLFNTSVRENLRLGRPNAGDDAIEQAARDANIHEFVITLPAGYDTIVGERGAKLSGGQRQRIAIARALLKDAPILVLDEATSNLDTENERLIREAIGRLMVGRTTLVIAHRLSTIQTADRVVMLDGGQVVASGRHAELIADEGVYARLVATQRRIGLLR
ncbi:MAG: thiol reductant ABC exporter subunit CydC [Dehalococcoidia bacterium]